MRNWHASAVVLALRVLRDQRFEVAKEGRDELGDRGMDVHGALQDMHVEDRDICCTRNSRHLIHQGGFPDAWE